MDRRTAGELSIGDDARATRSTSALLKCLIPAVGLLNLDACGCLPTTLLKLALALERLGNDASSVRILFVSVDPKRDSPALLANYVEPYAPEIMGLTGSEDELNAFTKRYHVVFRPEAADSTGAYQIYISSDDVYAFDRGGRARILIGPSESEDQISEDLKTLIG